MAGDQWVVITGDYEISLILGEPGPDGGPYGSSLMNG